MSGRWTPYGERGLYVDLGLEKAPDRATRTHAAAAALRERLGARALEVVVGAGAILVTDIARGVDVEALALEALGAAGTQRAAGSEGVSASAAALPSGREAEATVRHHVVSVVYDGPDLTEVATLLGVSPEEVIALHTGAEVVVELLGFLPGFAYCSGVAPRLSLPRRGSPRASVPAGSVAVAGGFTGIYPRASPGGWWLLGRALGVTPFDPGREPAMLFAPGDRVRFARAEVPSSEHAAVSPGARGTAGGSRAVQGASSGQRALDLVAVSAVATIQDGGRPGRLSQGLPPSGPLDATTHAAANRAVGNPSNAAAIEIPLGSLEVQAVGEVVVSIDGARAVRLSDGERLRVPSSDVAVRYLAVQGGIDVPVQLGARATLLAAGLGGFEGRPLRRRDRLLVGETHQESRRDGADDEREERGGIGKEGGGGNPDGSGEHEECITLDPGPHVDRFPPGALDALVDGTWHVSRHVDRVGMRLEGARVPREGPDLALPAPMVRGAVQVTTDGTPIVLGPDHPVTGGYPVLAVVRPTRQAQLARRRPGEAVRFALAR
ncbi:carboxyltransferase domain-containing protein [Chondromyces crocatus]|uniref:Urea amidolyase n=1 Tax=Chondromyces crocatus TaxID=52 RepID=A0A0K1E9B0_CHOCO|nr:carboxyltransferase domain-containing protein [Chondromyces crocatus]AKT37262.1 uncharacterized protein CMC5_013930 [Chondromyces crocatus]